MVKEFLTYHMVSLQSKVIFYCLYWKGNLSIKMQKKKKITRKHQSNSNSLQLTIHNYKKI